MFYLSKTSSIWNNMKPGLKFTVGPAALLVVLLLYLTFDITRAAILLTAEVIVTLVFAILYSSFALVCLMCLDFDSLRSLSISTCKRYANVQEILIDSWNGNNGRQ